MHDGHKRNTAAGEHATRAYGIQIMHYEAPCLIDIQDTAAFIVDCVTIINQINQINQSIGHLCFTS